MKQELKAPSMVEYVEIFRFYNPEKLVDENWSDGRFRKLNLIYLYSAYLKSQLHLWQLIPCGKDGKPLVKPECYSDYLFGLIHIGTEDWKIECQEYQEAEARVIYQGFEYKIDEFGNEFILLNNHGIAFKYDGHKKWDMNNQFKTHEDLQRLGVYFTEETAKKIKIV